MDKRIFAETLRDLRRQKGMSQEQLSDMLGISVQAVSKWECAQSYPDIEMLPAIADIMEVSIDYILRGQKDLNFVKEIELPDDNVLRIVQFRGKNLIRKDNYDPDTKVNICIENDSLTNVDKIEIWGNADISGDIEGDINVGGRLNCDDIDGDVNVGGTLSCGDIDGDINVGGRLDCGDIDGEVNVGGTLSCGDIDGDVNVGGTLSCGDIDGDVDVGGAVNCGDVGGNVTIGDTESVSCGDVEGDVSIGSGKKVSCGDINGNVSIEEGELHCQSIEGDAECSGNIYYDN